jgi:excisionase family DNA binding protein
MLTLKETAEYLRISTKSARKLIQDGELNAAMIGKRWKIRPEDLQQFIRSRQPGADNR